MPLRTGGSTLFFLLEGRAFTCCAPLLRRLHHEGSAVKVVGPDTTERSGSLPQVGRFLSKILPSCGYQAERG